VYDTGKRKILLSTYSEIVSSEENYLFKILDFYNIPRNRFVLSELKRTINDMHFRVGREDEWRDVFTREQIIRTTDIIGTRLLERFNWPL
jgi:hypothetical protein